MKGQNLGVLILCQLSHQTCCLVPSMAWWRKASATWDCRFQSTVQIRAHWFSFSATLGGRHGIPLKGELPRGLSRTDWLYFGSLWALWPQASYLNLSGFYHPLNGGRSYLILLRWLESQEVVKVPCITYLNEMLNFRYILWLEVKVL